MWNQLRTSVHLWSCPGTNIQPMKIRFSFRTKVRHMSVIDHCQNQETGLELKRCLGQWHVTTYSFGSSKHTLPLGLRHQETHLMFYGFSRVLSFIDSLRSYTLRATGNGQWLHGETLTFFVPYNIVDLCLGTLYNGSRCGAFLIFESSNYSSPIGGHSYNDRWPHFIRKIHTWHFLLQYCFWMVMFIPYRG